MWIFWKKHIFVWVQILLGHTVHFEFYYFIRFYFWNFSPKKSCHMCNMYYAKNTQKSSCFDDFDEIIRVLLLMMNEACWHSPLPCQRSFLMPPGVRCDAKKSVKILMKILFYKKLFNFVQFLNLFFDKVSGKNMWQYQSNQATFY